MPRPCGRGNIQIEGPPLSRRAHVVLVTGGARSGKSGEILLLWSLQEFQSLVPCVERRHASIRTHKHTHTHTHTLSLSLSHTPLNPLPPTHAHTHTYTPATWRNQTLYSAFECFLLKIARTHSYECICVRDIESHMRNTNCDTCERCHTRTSESAMSAS